MRLLRKFLCALATLSVVAGVGASVAGAHDIPYGREADPEAGGAVSGRYPDRDMFGPYFLLDYCFFNVAEGNRPNLVQVMNDIVADSGAPLVTGESVGCGNGHEDVIFVDFDFDCDGFNDQGQPVTPCSQQDQGGPAGTSGCATALFFGVCDKSILKIDIVDIFIGTANEPGGFTTPHYNWNIQHLVRHEVGHALGFKHSSAPGTCGPPNAYQWVDSFSAMGPDYPCTPSEAYTYPPERLEWNAHEKCNMDVWIGFGVNAGANC